MTAAQGLLAPVLPRAAKELGVARILPGHPGVTLTFDDGPHSEGTSRVLEILAAADARAMFFLVGERAERCSGLAARIAAGGHIVGLHGYHHRLQLRMSARELQDDLERGAAALEQAVGRRPVWHRPPYGIYSPDGLAATRKAGLRPLLWSRWGKDWRKFTTPSRIAARATRNLSRGDVILLHDADYYSARNSHRRTVQALPVILRELERRGLDTVLPV